MSLAETWTRQYGLGLVACLAAGFPIGLDDTVKFQVSPAGRIGKV